jgi:redox-sensitive bicupin YhaK (pirin superfamily)
VLDPFLLLDDIRSDRPEDYERGFPEHPHRGFETVTYVLSGTVHHKDSVGNEGRLTDGAAQWMTAGHGIVHSEMPDRREGLFWGLQLWVNLPRASKMTAPRYQDIAPARIPEVSVSGARVRLVAGEVGRERGPVDGIVVAPTMMDVTLGPGQVFEHELPPGHTAFAYGLDGASEVGAEAAVVARAQIAVLGPGALFRARGGRDGGRLLLLAAQPIGEPVARRGPFVMNTEEELDRAFADYRAGTLTTI